MQLMAIHGAMPTLAPVRKHILALHAEGNNLALKCSPRAEHCFAPVEGAPSSRTYVSVPFDCLRLSEMDFIAVIDMRLRLA